MESMKSTLVCLRAIVALAARGDFELNRWVGYTIGRVCHVSAGRSTVSTAWCSNTESQRALHNGFLDAAGFTPDEALRLADVGVPLKIVAALDVSQGCDAVLARSRIASPVQLRGRRSSSSVALSARWS